LILDIPKQNFNLVLLEFGEMTRMKTFFRVFYFTILTLIFWSILSFNKIYSSDIELSADSSKGWGKIHGSTSFRTSLQDESFGFAQDRSLTIKGRINKIEIIRHNIFDPNRKEENIFLFRLANKLHVKTKEKVIKDELLFKEDDFYDPDLLEESERNLRKLPFLGDVELMALPANPKRDEDKAEPRVDIFVETNDLWSTSFSAIASGGGGKYNLEGYLIENNLLGYGKALGGGYGVTHQEDDSGMVKSGSLFFHDPNFYGTHWMIHSDYQKRSDGGLFLFSVERPLYALRTKWGMSTWFSKVDSLYSYFDQGKTLFEYKSKKREGGLGVTRSYGVEFKRNLSFVYEYDENKYAGKENGTKLDSLVSLYLPPNRTTSWLELIFGLGKYDFDEVTYIDNFGRVEDVRSGYWAQMALGWSPKRLGSSREENYFSPSIAWFTSPGKNNFLFGDISLGSYWVQNHWEKVISEGGLRYYFKGFPHQTFALRLKGISSWRTQSSYQLLLGGDNGLRGYKANRFNGENLVLLNLEDRLFSRWEILTVALGGVFFTDIGDAWRREEKLKWDDLHTDIGFGLRFGFTKACGSLVQRIDFAWALDEKSFYISFGSGMLFDKY
jgi:outer membrane protein assembly factor BamA